MALMERGEDNGRSDMQRSAEAHDHDARDLMELQSDEHLPLARLQVVGEGRDRDGRRWAELRAQHEAKTRAIQGELDAARRELDAALRGRDEARTELEEEQQGEVGVGQEEEGRAAVAEMEAEERNDLLALVWSPEHHAGRKRPETTPTRSAEREQQSRASGLAPGLGHPRRLEFASTPDDDSQATQMGYNESDNEESGGDDSQATQMEYMDSQTVGASTAATTENGLVDLLASFSEGCAHCGYRDRWILVGARNPATRESLRGRGIKHLADVLGRVDYDAVESIVKPLLRSKANPVKLPTGIAAPADVKVHKASSEQAFGGKAKYVMFGESEPSMSNTVQRQLEQGMFVGAGSSPNTSGAATPAPASIPSIPGYAVGGDGLGYQYKDAPDVGVSRQRVVAKKLAEAASESEVEAASNKTAVLSGKESLRWSIMQSSRSAKGTYTTPLDQWEKDCIYRMRDEELRRDAAYMEKQYKDEEQANYRRMWKIYALVNRDMNSNVTVESYILSKYGGTERTATQRAAESSASVAEVCWEARVRVRDQELGLQLLRDAHNAGVQMANPKGNVAEAVLLKHTSARKQTTTPKLECRRETILDAKNVADAALLGGFFLGIEGLEVISYTLHPAMVSQNQLIGFSDALMHKYKQHHPQKHKALKESFDRWGGVV